MYMNSGYLNNIIDDFQDNSRPLIVGSCGTYHLHTQPAFHTLRPEGRIDYQLLYIAAGKAHFFFEGKEEVVPAGHMVLYRPGEAQNYVYYSADKTEVYWIHFTGNAVEEILAHYEIPATEHIFFTGTSLTYSQLFSEIIRELQMGEIGFEELLSMYLKQIFLLIRRQIKADHTTSSYLLEEVSLARDYFLKHYPESISIEDYAASRNMSTCWFIRSFKQITGTTPLQYILSVRIANAQSLLENTDYNVAEVASIVGYENSLYFSRIFKKQNGVSPLDYRKMVRGNP